MTNIRIQRELSRIIRTFDEYWLDDVMESQFAKEHLKEFIENILDKLTALYERIDCDRIAKNKEKAQKETETTIKNNFILLSKINQLRCLLMSLENKLKDSNIKLPYSMSFNI